MRGSSPGVQPTDGFCYAILRCLVIQVLRAPNNFDNERRAGTRRCCAHVAFGVLNTYTLWMKFTATSFIDFQPCHPRFRSRGAAAPNPSTPRKAAGKQPRSGTVVVGECPAFEVSLCVFRVTPPPDGGLHGWARCNASSMSCPPVQLEAVENLEHSRTQLKFNCNGLPQGRAGGRNSPQLSHAVHSTREGSTSRRGLQRHVCKALSRSERDDLMTN